MPTQGTAIAGLFREQAGLLVAQLARRYGAHRLDDIEDAVQDALLAAMRTWPLRGQPDNPGGWLHRAARNALIDRLRRAHKEVNDEPPEQAADEPPSNASFDGDLLELLFLCALPELTPGLRLSLMLKLACGLGAAEIAGVLLTSEASVLQRIVRAKEAVRAAASRPALPDELPLLQERIQSVAQSIYLLFTVGYFSSHAQAWFQPELCRDALRMARVLADDPRTRTAETGALAALLCFSAARMPARGAPDAPPIPLAAQDRSLWLRPLIDEGFRRFDRSIDGRELTRYHIECAIAACHARAASMATTDWEAVLGHYDLLCQLYPSPSAQLNRLVALARAQGATVALAELGTATQLRDIEDTTAYHATLAQLHEELGNTAAARAHYEGAARLADGTTLAQSLRRRAQRLDGLSAGIP
jgi:RNA polymerase sigma-70 factor (ECF subfamily)